MKNILLLTDFSGTSNNAIKFAIDFFKKESCHFVLMHVHKTSSYTSDNLMLSTANENLYNSIVQEQKDVLNALIENYKNENNNKHSFEAIVDFDNFTDAINQIIKIKNIDLIVMGSNGKTGAQEVLFGSNTSNVIRRVNCSTLLVPENFTYQINKELLLPLDSVDSLHGTAIIELHKFIKHYDYNLNVLRVKPHGDHNDYDFYDKSNLAAIRHKYFIINDIPTHYATHSFTQIKGIELIAVIVHKERFFERFFKGSTTTKLSNSIQVPILVLHND